MTIIFASVAMRRAMDLVLQFAPTDLPVMIVGPTGVGKELIAQEIHRLSGRTGQVVDVNCAALPRDLVEGELFGHRKGAFTGAVDDRGGLVAAADRGTLYLDELCSLPIDGQGKLLRVLESGEYRRVGETTKRRTDFRLVSAARESIAAACADGRFRADLFHRAAGLAISIPALVDRAEDLLPLASHFATLAGRRLAPDVRAGLHAYDWPGNVRELRAAVGRSAVLTAPDEPIGAATMARAIELGRLQPHSGRPQSAASTALRSELLRLCESHAWDLDLAALSAGVGRATLYRRLKKAGLSRPSRPADGAPSRAEQAVAAL